MERRIKLVIDSNIENIPLVASAVNRLCSFIPLSDVESYQVEVCVVEAVSNAIKHAYNSEAGHEIEVIFTLYPDRLVLDVCDFGRTMQEKDKPSLDFDPDDLRNLPEGGMGLFIINSIMDELSYGTRQGKNTLTITKFFNSPKESRVV